MTFGEKLHVLRKQRDISQEELAEKLHASRSAISRWETGQSMPELDKLLLISDLFSVSLDYLLKDKPHDSDMETISDFIPLKILFWLCTAINIIGLMVAMYGWHRLQSAFFVVIGTLMNMLACVFFEVFHPKEIDRTKARYIRRRFYAANAWILLPTPVYITIEIICSGEYYDTIAPHLLPFVVYVIAAMGITIYLMYKNRK